MGKYDDAIGGGKIILDVEEVLNEESAKKVDERIKKQKAELEKPAEVEIKTDRAVKRLEELTKAAKQVKSDLQEALSSKKSFEDINKLVSKYEALKKNIKALTPNIDKNNASLKESNKALKDTKKLIDQLSVSQDKLKNKTIKPKTDISTKKEAEITKDLVDTTEQLSKTQDKSAKNNLRTSKQVNAELENEQKKLLEIEAQQAKNDAARERFKKKQANYGQEVLGVGGAVYDTDILKDAKKELEEFNKLLETRNKFQDKYNILCRMVENYYAPDKPGRYGISNGIYKNLDQFVELNSSMKQLDILFENGQKTTNKTINGLFKNVVRELQSEINTVSRMISSGEVFGDVIGQKLDAEERKLNKENQRLLDERESQLTKITTLRQEELDLIKQQGQEESKNFSKLKFANGDILNETQVKAVEKYCSILKKSMGEAYNEARELKAALDLVFNIKEGNVANLMDRFTAGNKASNAALQIMTGMSVNNQTNRNTALRSINPDVYDQIVAEQKVAAEKAKAELAAQKSDFQKQWDEFVAAMLGGDAFKDESNLIKGKILKEFSSYADTASEAIDKLNKAWLSGDLEGKSGKTKYIQAYIDYLDNQKEYFESIRNAKAGDMDIDSLFGFSGATGLSEEKAKALRDEAAAWNRLIDQKKEYYGISTTNEVLQQEQEKVSSTIAEQTERTAQGEKELAAAAEKTAEAKQKQVKASKKVSKNSALDVSAEELIARDVNEALKQLRSAKNNETTLFTLKGVFEGEDLVKQAQKMVKNIAEQANLSLGKFDVNDDTIKVQLYNEELKVTVDQMYELKAATEEVESAQLKLVSQRFHQNVKALNENTFDVEGAQQKALASIEEVRSSLHGLDYDLKDLEKEANSISSQDDFNTFNNQLKATQDNIRENKNSTREQYKSLLDIINKINSVNSNILKYQGKDGGSGLFSGYISQLQSDKQKLVSELQSITQEINNALSGGFVQGKEFSIPFTNILSDDGGAVSSFLNDTKTQAALTTEEIEKLVVALQKTQNIDVEAAARVTEQFKSVQETYKQITSLATLDKNGSLYKGVENVFVQIMQYKDTLSSDPTQWTSEQSANLQALIDKFNEYGNVLVQAGQKEAQYFAGKTKYTQDTTMDNMIQNATEKTKKLTDVKKQLEEAARSFAQESGASDAFVTNFTQSADGISKLDFSVFDTATNSLRNFRMEMGSVSEGMYVTETTINKSLTNIQAAQKQIQSMSDLVVRLGQSGVNINSDTATGQVSKLLQLLQQLRAETAKGDGADQSILSKLTKDAKLSCAEVEKLYKQLIQMQNSINSGEAKSLGVVDLNGDKYSQMAEKIKEFAATFPDAALNIGKLNEETGKLPFTITSAGGEMTSFEAKVNSLNGQMVSQKKGVQQLGSSWDQFKNSLSKTGKQLMTALVGYNVFFKAISEIRKGINYVKEIDLAMTELKKVTDETEASYDRFLKTASKTAGAIGSTVSDFTEATANFARLGYTMEESADMAETAIVYKNVADGLDTVEESTDSIISTMKAFGIESDDTMGIIDRFNEVGNRFAITSAGIGEALQRSASALYEAGNTIDESIGLVTAANSVIQNPEQVGE